MKNEYRERRRREWRRNAQKYLDKRLNRRDRFNGHCDVTVL